MAEDPLGNKGIGTTIAADIWHSHLGEITGIFVRFLGVHAAVDSLRFAFAHPWELLRLSATWATIAVGALVLYAAVAQPLGRGVGFDEQIAATASNVARYPFGWVASLLPVVVGNLTIGLNWSRFALLGEEPRNPVRFMIESGLYFGRMIQVNFLGCVAAAPGLLVAIYVGRDYFNYAAAPIALLSLLAALGGFLFVYAQLQVVLAASAIGDSISVREAFALTRGSRTSLTVGLVLSMVFPLVPLVLLVILFLSLSPLLPASVAAMVSELTEDTVTCAGAALVAGFGAKALLLLQPPEMESREIASYFE